SATHPHLHSFPTRRSSDLDALAIGLAWTANYLQTKPADESKTYGYHRAGVLSAFVNALTLAVLSLWIVYEAVLRLRAPRKRSRRSEEHTSELQSRRDLVCR